MKNESTIQKKSKLMCCYFSFLAIIWVKVLKIFSIHAKSVKFLRVEFCDFCELFQGVDSLINFETVKYHGAEQFEVDRFRASLVSYQKESWKNSASMQLMNVVQILIIYASLFGGQFLIYFVIFSFLEALRKFENICLFIFSHIFYNKILLNSTKS